MMLETDKNWAIPQSDFKTREAYLSQLERALPVLVKHSPLQFIQWLDSTDEQVRFVAIETLSQFSDLLGDNSSTIPEIVEKHIYQCRNAGRFRELYQLIQLWQKITGQTHELIHDANEILAFVVRHAFNDNETEAYISLAFTIAEQNAIELSSCHKKISLSNDESSSWIDYQIMVPCDEPLDKVFKMNLHLVDSAGDISKHVRQYMIVMFR
ncbi:MAG TPA: hypothetical protein DCM38_10900 [Gammaproteobacteria bacterium]|nr:hypothetical protein [Gammaproteobacteria bacterium]